MRILVKYIKSGHFVNYGMFFYLLLLIISIWSSACGDKCKDIYCENGYCIKGDCFCDNGYSGENCDIKDSDKFVGLYKGKLSFIDIPDEQNVDVKVKNRLDNPFNILINISSHNGVNFDLKANVKQDSILIGKSFNEHITNYDTIVNLIYPSRGILKQDSIIEIPIVYKNVDYHKVYTIQVTAIKQN